METFLINLKYRPDRLKQFVGEAKREEINYERIDAINGKEINRKEYWINKYDNRRSLKPGEIGVYLSHYECMEKSKQDLALIFEDDAKLCLNFKDKLNILMEKVPEDWDILLLGTTKLWKRKYRSKCQLLPTAEDEYFYKVSGDIYGLQGYVINKKAINHLIDCKFPIMGPIDVIINNIGLNVYISKEELVGTHQMGSNTQ